MQGTDDIVAKARQMGMTDEVIAGFIALIEDGMDQQQAANLIVAIVQEPNYDVLVTVGGILSARAAQRKKNWRLK